MTLTQEAAELMKEAAVEITRLRLQNAVLVEALEDLVEAVPNQNNDRDWWPDELTEAMRQAMAALVMV